MQTIRFTRRWHLCVFAHRSVEFSIRRSGLFGYRVWSVECAFVGLYLYRRDRPV